MPFKKLIFLSVLILFITGCKPDSGTSSLLSCAEALMDVMPDSALVLLKNIDGKKINGRELKARYSLLYSAALDKNAIDISSDSVIQFAKAYYAEKGTAVLSAEYF